MWRARPAVNVAGMRSTALIRFVCALGVLCLLAPAAADAARKPKRLNEALYTVIARAEMKEEWNFLERSEIECGVGGPGSCTTETKGSGKATMQLKAKPTTWMVLRGTGGRPPMLNVGTGEGAQLTGPYLRTGELSTIHGGQWAAANPPQISPTTGCGNQRTTVDFNLMWKGRNQLAPSAIVDDLREDCPEGPSAGFEWENDDSPSLMEVVTQAAQSKLLHVKQFTVSGTKTWKAGVNPPTGAYTVRSGYKTVKWTWSVTFQMKGKKRR